MYIFVYTFSKDQPRSSLNNSDGVLTKKAKRKNKRLEKNTLSFSFSFCLKILQSYPSQLRATVVFSLSLRSSLGSTLVFCLLFLLLSDYVIGPLSTLLRLFYTYITHLQIKDSALEEGNVLLRKSSRYTRYRTHSF